MSLLTVNQLFQPAPSGVGPFGNVPIVPPQGTWLSQMLSNAATVQLPTTSWQSGAPERTILAIEAISFSQSDINVSTMAQGGFLQSAASGTVTFIANDGTNVTIPVTPDPSNAAQNPTGAPGWLDLLGENVYDTTRLQATDATGPLALVNLKGSSVGPYLAGGYHVANTATGATYHNLSSLTIPSSIIAGSGGVVTNVQPGLTFTVVTTSAPHGLATGNVAYLVIPSSTGITGLNGVFGIVTGTTTNTFSVSISTSGTYVSGGTVFLCTVATMAADAAGTASNAAPNAVQTTITQNAGVFAANVIGWSGSNWESNTAYAARCVLSLAIRSPNGPSQSYVFYAESAQQILSTGILPGGATIPVYNLTNGPVSANEYVVPATGIVTTVVASATPVSTVLGANVTPGISQLPISGVSNANPGVVTTSGATSLSPGQSMIVTISGVLGMAGVNGTFVGTYVTANSFSIPVNTTSAGAYAGGGSVDGGDLGQIDLLIQTNVVPSDTTAVTVSALALPISIVATVVVPQVNVAAYALAVQTQLQTQLQSYPIGGAEPGFAVAYDDIVGALEEAGVVVLGQPSYVRQVQSMSLNGQGPGLGVAFPSANYVALLVPPTISVLGV
jgi:trimeric autotransporter adhesin